MPFNNESLNLFSLISKSTHVCKNLLMCCSSKGQAAENPYMLITSWSAVQYVKSSTGITSASCQYKQPKPLLLPSTSHFPAAKTQLSTFCILELTSCCSLSKLKHLTKNNIRVGHCACKRLQRKLPASWWESGRPAKTRLNNSLCVVKAKPHRKVLFKLSTCQAEQLNAKNVLLLPRLRETHLHSGEPHTNIRNHICTFGRRKLTNDH